MGITAAMVKAMREKTGLPMMDCKKALTKAEGDEAKAIELLREAGLVKIQKMAGREATEGRIGTHVEPDGRAGIVELRCETSPVANTDDFVKLAQTLARHVALAEAPTVDNIRDLPLMDDSSRTLGDLVNGVFNRLRENIKIARVEKLCGSIGQYVHHNGQVGVLVQMNADCPGEIRSDMCMHIAAMNPPYLNRDEVDADEVERQRAQFSEEAKGKPEPVIEKIVTGKLNRWFSEITLLDQPFVKEDKKSVEQILKESSPDLTISRFVRYEVGVR